ncbi:MAG TPA: hypothetical protein VFR86_07380, partial [Burkholderiaceae bacterium]|nr:hypothetical protein [Burkholderiaceae bacterium]
MDVLTELGQRRAAQVADGIEAAAAADLYAAAPAALAQKLGLQVAQQSGATVLLAADLPSPMFNRVIGLGLHAPASAQDLENVSARFRAAGVAAWWLHWNPFAAPADF